MKEKNAKSKVIELERVDQPLDEPLPLTTKSRTMNEIKFKADVAKADVFKEPTLLDSSSMSLESQPITMPKAYTSSKTHS